MSEKRILIKEVTAPCDNCCGAGENVLFFLFGPILAVIWLYIWIVQEFFGRKLK